MASRGLASRGVPSYVVSLPLPFLVDRKTYPLGRTDRRADKTDGPTSVRHFQCVGRRGVGARRGNNTSTSPDSIHPAVTILSLKHRYPLPPPPPLPLFFISHGRQTILAPPPPPFSRPPSPAPTPSLTPVLWFSLGLGRPSKLPAAATPSARPCARPSASSGVSWRGPRRRTPCPTSSPLCSRKPAWKARP